MGLVSIGQFPNEIAQQEIAYNSYGKGTSNSWVTEPQK